jgi:SAM-dependent methyltransferase
VPEAEVVVGDLEALPFEDGAFDVVAGFNAFQFADDVVAALVEAARVTRPGGRVVVQMWGRPERCELLPVLGRLAPLLPFRAPGPPGGGNFSDAGVLERLAGQAGLEPAKRCSVTTTIAYADEEELLRVLMAAGLSQIAARAAGEDAVREAFRGAAAGKVRYANEWIWLVARKP